MQWARYRIASIKAMLQQRCSIVLLAKQMADANVSGADKAAALRSALRLRAAAATAHDDDDGGADTQLPLMDQLGAKSRLLCCRESSFEWELVVPHALLESETSPLRIASTRVVHRFARNEFGVANRIADGPDGAFRRFDEATVNEWPNEPPEWLVQLMTLRENVDGEDDDST